jgi:hypothetical protein
MGIYDLYSDYVKSICLSGDIKNFKNHPHYTFMLEHVSEAQGHEYLHYIKTRTQISEDEIKEFCRQNDALGNPLQFDYGFMASPSSLRYIFQAHLILTHMQGFTNRDLVEVGGGYGGLCFALYHFSKKYGITINSYAIVDLPNISTLQRMYISTLSLTDVEFIDATTFGADITRENLFLVSNYCFSEIVSDFQEKYIQTLFPKVQHGFMAWNNIPTYNFGFQIREEEEYPKTGYFNKYVYF